MCLVTGPGQMATVGTVLEISQHERKPDGRMLIMSKGAERFRVTKILKEKPYIVAEIEDFHDVPGEGAPPPGRRNSRSASVPGVPSLARAPAHRLHPPSPRPSADVPGEGEENLVDFGNEVRQLFLDTLRLSTKSKARIASLCPLKQARPAPFRSARGEAEPPTRGRCFTSSAEHPV